MRERAGASLTGQALTPALSRFAGEGSRRRSPSPVKRERGQGGEGCFDLLASLVDQSLLRRIEAPRVTVPAEPIQLSNPIGWRYSTVKFVPEEPLGMLSAAIPLPGDS